ncbi:hypothetical protein PROFUN_01124 [Planoprotostelium fungivorum]|uniref:Uncharacterized protein n=1 Tax=Planoprotostelium fungivorum TaxID=1890364 RepID=A0A2P6NCD2_9EUKA|nr:hypothetical protein PROFUN_01124 [Planoprotostelium fungivorum]
MKRIAAVAMLFLVFPGKITSRSQDFAVVTANWLPKWTDYVVLSVPLWILFASLLTHATQCHVLVLVAG